MKRILLLGFILLFGYCLEAQRIADGYLVEADGDTIKTKIKITRDLFGPVMFEKIERRIKTIDSGNSYAIFRPKEISRFGAFYDDGQHDFVAKPVNKRTERYFERIVDGNNAKCF